MTTSPDRMACLAAAMAAADDVAYDWDLRTDSIAWAGSVAGLFASSCENLVATGEAFNQRINPEDLPVRLKALAEHYRTRETYDCEYRLRKADGAFCWVHDRGRAEFDSEGQPVRLRGVLRLVNQRKAYEAQLEHQANYDELTGQFNRSRLRRHLQQAINQAQRYQNRGAYLTVGIDKLSLINNAFGYATADSVIIGVGQRLQKFLRASDTVGRVGGDLYGIVLDQCPVDQIAVVAEKILRLFRESPMQTPAGPIHVTVSIGGVTLDYVKTAYEAMAQAESALQQAKRSGRDCFVLFCLSEEQKRAHRHSLEMGERVKAALKENRFSFAFQPVVDAQTGEVRFYEGLLRMVETDGAVTLASDFVPGVERLGMARLLDHWVLEMAVAELIRFPTARLAVNISGFTASDRSWLRSLMMLLKGRPQVVRRLIVEITETAAIQDMEETARFTNIVRELGCQVALDDFGAGYISFRHMKSLAVDIVKIDGTFVGNITENPDNLLFIRSLISLAHGFGLTTIAECVETAKEAELLRREGVRLLQGYYYGAPSLERPWGVGDLTNQPIRFEEPAESTDLAPAGQKERR